jgi:integrase
MALVDINRRTIAKLDDVPAGKVHFTRDATLKGFAIKTTAKGSHSFTVEGRIKRGGTYRITLGSVELMDLDEARTEAKEILRIAERGLDPRLSRAEASPATQTLAWCLEQHVLYRGIRETTATTYRNQINNCFKDWLPHPAEQISFQMVGDRRAKLERDKNSEYVKSAFRTLKAILGNADIPFNPVKKAQTKWKWTLQADASEQIHYLTGATIKSLIEGYIHSQNSSDVYLPSLDDTDGTYLGSRPEPNVFAATLFLLLVGGRKQDAISLRWDQVDLQEGVITYPKRSRKERKPFKMPLVGMVKDIIEAQPRHLEHPDLVFGMTDNMFKERYKRLVAPITNQSSKCLRVSWAEYQGLNGFDDSQIQMGLNHSAPQSHVTQKNYKKKDLAALARLSKMYLVIQGRFMAYYLGHVFADDPFAVSKDIGPVKIREEYFSLSKVDKLESLDFTLLKFPTFFKEIGATVGDSPEAATKLVEWNNGMLEEMGLTPYLT